MGLPAKLLYYYRLAISFAIFMLDGVGGVAIAQTAAEYFPLRNGLIWVYSGTDSTRYTVYSSPGPTYNGVATTLLSETQISSDEPHMNRWYFSNSFGPLRLHYKDSPDSELTCRPPFSSPLNYFPSTLTPGSTAGGSASYPCESSGINVVITWRATSIVGTRETITVPFGTFSAIKVTTTVTASYKVENFDVVSKEEHTAWFAAGIGQIKRIFKGSGTINGQPAGEGEQYELALSYTNAQPQEEPDDECDCTQMSSGVTLNYATGAVSVKEEDITSTAHTPLGFWRIFKGNGEHNNTGLGAGWVHNYSRSAIVASYVSLGGPESIFLSRESGETIRFENKNGRWVSDTDLKGRISVTRAGILIDSFTYRNVNDEIEFYDGTGRLLSIRHLGGMRTIFSYGRDDKLESVRDSFGKKLTFTYDDVGRLVSVTPSNGHAIKYNFKPSGELDVVTLPDEKNRKYKYQMVGDPQGAGSALRLKSVEDQNGFTFLNLVYDENARVKSRSYGPNVGEMTVDYPSASARTITDALSTARTVTFGKVMGRNRRLTLSSECSECADGGTAKRIFDAFGNIIERINFNGIRTKYEYDTARGLQTSRTEAFDTPLSRVIKTTWHPEFRLPASISEPLRRTTYVYDVDGNVLKKTVQATSDTTGTLGFNATLVGEAQVHSYTYGAGGRMLTATGPRTDITQTSKFDYDTSGNLIRITDPVGQITGLSRHDSDGRPGRITMPDGALFDYTFKPNGLLETITVTADGRAEVTSYGYDDVGKIKTVSLPDQTTYLFTYDTAQRLKEVGDQTGNRVELELDRQGNRLSEKTYGPSGELAKQIARSFDNKGRLKQQIGGL